MKTIVVGYDETEPAKRALARAAEFATAFDAEVIVTSVAPVLVGARDMGAIDPVNPPDVYIEDLEHAKAFLSERGVTGRYEMAIGDPAKAIVELADASEADMIIVGTRQPSLVSSILGLSVSGAVKRKAHCDVLTVQ